MAATTDHARDLAEALRDLLAVTTEIASTGNAVDDDVKVRRATAMELLENDAAIRARRTLQRFEWEGR